MSAAEKGVRAGRHDASARRLSARTGRERGCWVYIPLDDLAAAGFSDGPPPYYRTTGKPHSRNTGTVLVRLYRER
jgi:hypothetical protein